MLKIRYILLLTLCVLMPVTAVHAETVTSTAGHHDQDIKDGEVVLKDAANRVTFTLSGPQEILYKSRSVGTWGMDAYDVGKVGRNSSMTLTINWTVAPGYDIEVTKIAFWGRAYGADQPHNYGGKIEFEGVTKGAGTNWVVENEDEGASFSVTKNFSNGTKIICKNILSASIFSYNFYFLIKNLQITYTLTPLFIFDGSGNGVGDAEHTKWGKADNWVLNTLPTIADNVIIRHDVVITEAVSARQITIESPNTVTVAPTGVLKVGAGGIKNATPDNFKLQAATGGADKGKTGVLLIDPACATMPNATAEMYSKAYFDMNVDASERNNAGAYQYVGSPLVAGTVAKTIFTNSWIYNWDEPSGEWKNNRKTLTLKPFEGYATSQYMDPAGLLIEHKGQLASNGNQTINLSYTATSAEPGINVLANSYTAPIDIKQFVDGDFSAGVEATIYLFNTGSKNDVIAHPELNGDLAGQFIAIPIHQAGEMVGSFQLPIFIPSMQGFYVKTNNDGSTLTLDYKRLVWEATNGNAPLRAKRADEQKKASLCVTIEADGWRDQVYLLEAEEYDAAFENGYDAHKLMQGNLNIFTLEGEDALAVDATNRIAGTKLGVRTGEETAYTLTFGSVSGEAEWSLYDAETQATIDIEEGTQYTFFAEPNSEIRDRFYITERNDAPAITTDLEEVNTGAASHKFIKDGQLFVMKNGLIYNTLGVVVSR
jgi:hypothetical protein